jgi:hypothetical protein
LYRSQTIEIPMRTSSTCYESRLFDELHISIARQAIHLCCCRFACNHIATWIFSLSLFFALYMAVIPGDMVAIDGQRYTSDVKRRKYITHRKHTIAITRRTIGASFTFLSILIIDLLRSSSSSSTAKINISIYNRMIFSIVTYAQGFLVSYYLFLIVPCLSFFYFFF